MTPIPFDESDGVLRGPQGGEIADLPVWTGGGLHGMVVSCWRPTWQERLSVLLFGRVWLNVMAWDTHPPVSLQASRTYFKEDEESR